MAETYQSAAAALVDMAAVQSAPFRNRDLAVSWDGVDPEFLDWSRAFLKELKARGLPFFAHCYVRNEADQERLFKEGRSKARFGASPHNYGMAVDVIHFGRWWDLSPKEWGIVGTIGKEVARKRNLRVTWGGDWRFYDPAHWEREDWRQRVPRAAVKAAVGGSFKDAFARARAAGHPSFEWRGRAYTTDRA